MDRKLHDMLQNLEGADLEKLQWMLEVKEAYNAGDLSLEEARAKLKEKVSSITPFEIALAEQKLQEFDEDECRKEDIQGMLDLYQGLIDTSRPDLPEDHPIFHYYAENEEMKKQLLAIEDLVQYPMIKNQWLEIYDALDQWKKIHLARKQNQLYPVLQNKGFDRPNSTMWLLDNFVRDEINEGRELLDSGNEDKFIAFQNTLVADIRDLMQKEETILYPTSLAMISKNEFETMKEGDKEIGYAFIDVKHKEAEATADTTDASGLLADLSKVLADHGLGGLAKDAELDVTTGKLTLDQINLIYQHMPIDLSFVDENEIVKFYTDTDHRIFPRSKNVIGRKVMNCHPRSSGHVVREIVDKFKSGEENEAEFWINKPDLFIYIKFFAVRDKAGNFRGVLEMMQDCTRIRSLEGSRTLLSWGEDHGVPEQAPVEPTEPEKEPEVAAPTVTAETLEITPETRLADILAVYPELKKRLPEMHPNFKALQTPLARIMLPKATVTTMSERSGLSVDEIIAGVKALIADL